MADYPKLAEASSADLFCKVRGSWWGQKSRSPWETGLRYLLAGYQNLKSRRTRLGVAGNRRGTRRYNFFDGDVDFELARTSI